MDTNSDNRVEFEEFARVMARNYYKKNSKEDIIEAFKRFDLNGSGFISTDEMRIVLSKMFRFVTREETEDIIRKIDRNKDGQISIEEFASLANFD